MASASDLFALQEVDLQRDARRAVIADIDARQGETEAIIATRERLAELKTEQAELRSQQKRLDDSIKDLDAKIGPAEIRLYDGSVHNPKELTDLQKDLDSMKAHRSAIEDEALPVIEALDVATKAVKETESDLKALEQDWREELADMKVRREKAEGEIAVLDKQKDLRSEGIDQQTMGLYERLRIQKQGKAVALAVRGICQGCNLTIPTHMAQRVRGGVTLVQCPSCERILVNG